MLHSVLSRLVKLGQLRVAYDGGPTLDYGDGSGPAVAVRITRRGERRIMRNPQLALGETYMDGDLEVVEGSLWDLMEIIGRNRLDDGTAGGPFAGPMRKAQRWLQQHNGRAAARRNVHFHYDLSVELYRRFLDRELQYSCAYFSAPGMDLDAAQAAKKAHLAAKLRIEPGQAVLDIGCGWGGLALELARQHGARVTGVTLSTEQLAVAQARARALGLDGRAQFRLADYRDVAGPFDRIVSVGMLEHVGAPNLAGYFAQVGRLLAEDGIAVIHAIGSRSQPGVTQPFIRKHIFPGGYIPSLSEVCAAVERAGLWITDIEILRKHYAETLRRWRLRFLKERPAIVAMYDERFCRMWEAYLCMCELAFRYLDCVVFQIQLTKRLDAAPLTRDYMYRTDEFELPAQIRAQG